MRYSAIVLIFMSLFLITSCGKSPLLNKLEKNTEEISGGIFLSEQFPNKNLEFSLTLKTPPSLDEMAVFELMLLRQLETSQTLNAFIWMPEMGHGSSPIVMTEENNKLYKFSEIAFIMPGLWVLHIQILENNQVVDEWQKSIML